MEIQEVTNLLVNNGVAVVVIGYFMFRDFKFMGQLQTTLVSLVDTVEVLKDCVDEMSRKEIK